MYVLFCILFGDWVIYIINLFFYCNFNYFSYFKFVGCIVVKVVYDNCFLECYFIWFFYKYILGKLVRYIDMESEDYYFY